MYPEPSSPLDVCTCGKARGSHVTKFIGQPGWGCAHFEKAEPSHAVREMGREGRCVVCGSADRDLSDKKRCRICERMTHRMLDDGRLEPLPQPNVPLGNHPMPPPGDPTPYTYTPPKMIGKLMLEERLLEHVANWHLVRARLRSVQEKIASVGRDQERKDSEFEAFYEFCVTLMKG
jgi:hypothetical protein